MTVDNPLGVDPDDPTGKDDIIVADPTFHLLLDQPVQVLLRSTDVLHDFAVPQFRVKMDLVPGLVTYQWFTPTKVGTYEMLCEELCGVGHFAMRGRMVVDNQADYDKWLASQPTFARHAGAAGRQRDGRGRELRGLLGMSRSARARATSCSTRRSSRGSTTGTSAASCSTSSTASRGAEKGDTFGPQMAPMSQTVADPATRENVLAHIKTLPDTPAPPTITGDVEHGRRLFETCQLCHGDRGEGRWGTNAPKLAGMSDWYLDPSARVLQGSRAPRRPRGRHLRRPDEHDRQFARGARSHQRCGGVH